jgi:hypothetical protein
MSFFDKIVTNIDDIEKEFLGPDYKYYEKISSPGELGMSSDGSISALSNDIAGIINYVELLVSGSGRASKTGKPLGDKFFIKTGGQCSDYKTNKLVTRSMYINNVPTSDIPIISNISGMSFPEFRGLIPGLVQDMYSINPIKMFRAFMEGNEPKCAEVKLDVIDENDNSSSQSAYIPIVELMDLISDGKISSDTVTSDMRKAIQTNNKESFLNIRDIIDNKNGLNKETKKLFKGLDGVSNIYIISVSLLIFYILYKTMKR